MEIELKPIEHSKQFQGDSHQSNSVSKTSEGKKSSFDNELLTKNNSSKSKRWFNSRMKSMKKHLFICFDICTRSSRIHLLAFVLFASMAITAGVLIVCFTSPKLNKQCQNTFRRMMKSSIISDSNPQSVTVDDLNNDHHMDIIVANSGTNTIGIFLSKGDGTFQDQQTYSTGSESRPSSIIVCHFNHDQHLDIAVANYYNNNIGIFLGNANGTFKNQIIVSLGSSHPLFITCADLNHDNQTDLVVANYGTNSISILLGYGNGSFHDQQIYSTGYDSSPLSIGIADFNQDHHLDLVVTNSGTNNIDIFLGVGNGTFSNQITYTTTHHSNPSSLVIADFNDDHHLDIAVSNNGSGNIGIFLGHGDGTFQSQTTYSIDSHSHSHPHYISSGHFNKDDNILDLVIIDSTNDRIHILLGYGNGSFARVTTYDTISDSHPIWLSVVDLNDNNQSDVVVANYGGNNILVLIDYFFEPAARQLSYGLRRAERNVVSVAINDFNNDSILDIVSNLGGTFFILTGFGNGSFNRNTIDSFGSSGAVQYICVGDLNNDDRMDIISANIIDNRLDIFLGDGNGTFTTMKSYSTGEGSQPRWAALGDFNHDHILDIVSTNYGTRNIGILLGDGNGSFTTMMNYSTRYNSPPLSVAVGDFNDDNYLDLVVADDRGWISIFLGFGNGSFILWEQYPVNTMDHYLGSVAVAHFNSDTHLDIVVANTENNNIAILVGHGNGTFATLSRYPTGNASQPLYVIVADFNNDNASDIAATNFGNDEVVIFYGYGNGSFQLQRTFSTGHGSKPSGIAAADLDHDHHLELVVAFWGTGKVAVLTEYMAAKFVNQTTYSTGSALHSVSVAIDDFNNDNRLDLVVANAGTDNLHILFGSSNGTFGTPMTYPIGTNSHPQYVITCDINNDHHTDIISVNSQTDSISVIMGYGNSTFAKQLIYSTGNNSHPSSLVADDINDDHRLDIVVANEGTNEIGIFFGYDYASFHDQVIYSTIHNKSPRKMVVNDFNNDHYLDIAVLFPYNDSFGILFGYGNGSFSNMTIYLTKPNSSSWGITAKDLNNDTCIDIIVTNQWIDSISVFLGYGNGSFASMMTYSTGNWSGPGDIVVDDCNNDHRWDIIVANSDGSSIGVLLGYGNGGFSSVRTTSIRERFYPRSIAVGYFNNDSYLDVAVAGELSDSVAVLFGYGNGTFGSLFLFGTRSLWNPFWISVGDFNRDNHLDIATANFNGNNVGILFGNGNGTFGNTMWGYSIGTGSNPTSISVDDFNDDNILDIAVANYGTNEIVVLFGLGDGRFLLGKPYSTGLTSAPWALVIGDFDNDSRLDIAVTNSQSNNIGIFLRYDTEPFGSIHTYTHDTVLQPHSVAVGDVDHDNRSDIVMTNYGSGTVEIWLEYDGWKKFNKVRQYSTGNGSAPSSIALAHLNNDTHLDIVVANSESDNILLLLGNGNGTFETGKTYSTGARSRPYSITINDFNGDHIMDIAIVNSGTSNILLLYGYGNGTFGKQTSYPLGYGYHPYSIAAKDVNNDNLIDIVIACYDTDHVEVFMQMCVL